MSDMVYRWSQSFDGVGRDAQKVGERLEALRSDSNGVLFTKDVVADARSEASPLHPFFEWNDRKAAVAHRLNQARTLIRAVVLGAIDDEEVSSRAYVADAESGGYRNTTDQLVTMRATTTAPASSSGRFGRDRAEEARRELRLWRERYGALESFADVVDAIDRVLDEELQQVN
jgi:hypothetical protein